MQHVADELMRLLAERLPALRAMNPAATTVRPAPGKWSAREILGHLIDSAANNHQRFIRAQFDGDYRGPGYQQDQWVASQGYNEREWADLIDLWHLYNVHLAHVINRIPAERLSKTCWIADYEPVTLRFVAEDYVAHMRNHLDQIATQSSEPARDRAAEQSP